MTTKTVDAWIPEKAPQHAALIGALRTLIRTTEPELAEAVKWNQPVYSHQGPALFIKPAKAHVSFGFWRGVELDDPEGLLTGSGVMMRHVKLKSADEVAARSAALTAFVQQATALNRSKGDPTRKANR